MCHFQLCLRYGKFPNFTFRYLMIGHMHSLLSPTQQGIFNSYIVMEKVFSQVVICVSILFPDVWTCWETRSRPARRCIFLWYSVAQNRKTHKIQGSWTERAVPSQPLSGPATHAAGFQGRWPRGRECKGAHSALSQAVWSWWPGQAVVTSLFLEPSLAIPSEFHQSLMLCNALNGIRWGGALEQ